MTVKCNNYGMGRLIPFGIVKSCLVCETKTTVQPHVSIVICETCRRIPWISELLNNAAIGEMVLQAPTGTCIQKVRNNHGGSVFEVGCGEAESINPDLEIALRDVFDQVI